ncbi:MAG: glycosyltransferase [candidate division Zixibacteria bacterium]|nr:glycosyltransferase [candidate division Zixibacteria bacterium]
MNINVLFLTSGLFIGGEETQNLQSFTRMREYGIHFTIATTKDAGPFAEPFRENGFEIFPDILKSRFDVSGIGRIRELIKEKGIDIMCTGGFGDALFFGRVAGKISGCKAIVNTFYHFGRLDRENAKIELVNNLIHSFTTVFKTSSLALRDYLIDEMAYPPDKVVAVHDGIDTTRFSPKKPDSSKYAELRLTESRPIVGIVASLYPFKGPDVFAEAAAIVHKQAPEAVFVMVGEGDQRPKIESIIAENGLEDVVHLLGYRKDVPEILPTFDISVLASDTEAFPNTLLEASACGKPIVSTAVGGAPEIVVDGYNGFLVPPREPRAMADKIIKLLDNIDLRKQMAENSLKRVREKFSIEHKVEVFSRFFEQLYRGEDIPPGLYD